MRWTNLQHPRKLIAPMLLTLSQVTSKKLQAETQNSSRTPKLQAEPQKNYKQNLKTSLRHHSVKSTIFIGPYLQ